MMPFLGFRWSPRYLFFGYDGRIYHLRDEEITPRDHAAGLLEELNAWDEPETLNPEP